MLTTCDDTANHRECKVVGLCRDCRHWEGGEEWMGKAWGECAAIGTATSSTPDAKASLYAAFAEEGPVLETREDFGCVLWEAKADG